MAGHCVILYDWEALQLAKDAFDGITAISENRLPSETWVREMSLSVDLLLGRWADPQANPD